MALEGVARRTREAKRKSRPPSNGVRRGPEDMLRIGLLEPVVVVGIVADGVRDTQSWQSWAVMCIYAITSDSGTITPEYGAILFTYRTLCCLTSLALEVSDFPLVHSSCVNGTARCISTARNA